MALSTKAQSFCIALLVMVLILAVNLNRSESSASTQSTDDAYIQADFTTVAAQVSGRVLEVLVSDNQPVKKGQLIATLDDRDFIVAVDAAKAQVASAQASIASLEAHSVQQQSAIRQARAALAGDNAALKLARENAIRYRNLAADGSGSVQALQQADAQMSMQSAGLEKNQAGVQLALQQLNVLAADLQKAKAALEQAQAARAAVELKLSYTRIVAPIDGIVGQKSIRVGAFIDAGKPLLAIVPLDAVYVTANFRETQLARVQPGQTVQIKVDALPATSLKGTVESIGPASGVSYSAIAPHNATGNFTKIVQRLPVRIKINPGQNTPTNLRVGMSVTPTIKIGG
ncbi:MAG: HlyD family secretion protein [Pseudomonadota bacterium]